MKALTRTFDVMILGGGPAGLSAALWCSELGLSSIVLERDAIPGGQLHWIRIPIKNYPGVEVASGAEFLERLMAQLRSRKFELETAVGIEHIDLNKKKVTLASQDVLLGSALVIATGVRRRKLGVEGEDEYTERGILATGQTDREKLKGKTLVIVGGGDAAFENASALSQHAAKTYMLHRREAFSARPEFIERVQSNAGVEMILNADVTRIFGKDRIEGLEYINNKTRKSGVLNVDAILVRIGVEPNTELFRQHLDMDEKGYVRTDHTGKTSVDGVFAIGDVANPISPTISTAVGTAATAAKSISSHLNAR